MNLATLQRHVAHMVMHPLTSASRIHSSSSGIARKIIKPNDCLGSLDRLEIYNRQYWFRLLDALSDDFPGLRSVLGDRRFGSLAKHYLTDHPSRSFTMRDLGSRLVSWLRKHPSYSPGRVRLALDMVRLEWAEIEAFDAAAGPPLTLANLVTIDPRKLQLQLQPYIRLLALSYPVEDLLLSLKQNTPPDVASNAVEERQKQRNVAAVARLSPKPVYLVVHRLENVVYFRRLRREAFTILLNLQQGRTVERAVGSAFRSSKIPVSERAREVAAWFQNWSSLGWFVLRTLKSCRI